MDAMIAGLAHLRTLLAPVPLRWAGAAVLVMGGWALARLARWMVGRAAGIQWLERILVRSGILSGLVEPSLSVSRRVFAGTIYWSLLLGGAVSALAVLNDRIAERLAGILLVLMPNLILGLAIILGFWWLSGYSARSVLIWMSNERIPHPWRWAAGVRITVAAIGIALASEATGFAVGLVRNAFLILLAGATFAAAQALRPILSSHLERLLVARTDETLEREEDPLLK